jgi:hypothetical protein
VKDKNRGMDKIGILAVVGKVTVAPLLSYVTMYFL